MTERAALLYLLRHGGRRWSAIADEVEERVSALAVLQDDRPRQLDLFAERAADPDLAAVEREIVGWEDDGMACAS